ncbi:MAG: hypothetical protein HY906_01470 [Deltaproteobacteria bacterium]|nr:hypothetical protein [Deltaproteobacteria bacterium]
MRHALLLVVLLASCTKHEPGETGSLRLSIVQPADAQPFAAAEQVEVRIVDPGRRAPFVQSMPWPPAADDTLLDFLISPEGSQWSLVVAAKASGSVIAVGRSGPFDLQPGQDVTVPVFVGVVNSFGAAPVSLAQARSGHTSLTLPDGRLVVVGGAAEGDPEAPTSFASPVVELIDPFGRTPCSSGLPCFGAGEVPPRTLHGAVLTDDGKVVIAGGLGEGNVPLADLWVLEPGQPTVWRDLSSVMAPRAGAAVALIGGGSYAGRVLVAGGCTDSSMTTCLEDAWAVKLEGGGDQVTGFGVVRFGATATPLPGHGDVLVAGGRDAAGLASAVYLFDSASGKMRPVDSLITPRERHVAVPLPDGSVLLAGGFDAAGAPLASAEVYVPWLPPAGRMLPAVSLTVARHGAAAVALADGSIVVVGGTDVTGASPSVERFVPQGPNARADAYQGAFSTFVALPDARTGAAVALGVGDELLVSGGRGASGAVADLLVLARCLPDDGLGCPTP